MIAVAGEALIDLVVGGDGAVAARPGGAAFNVARTVARLGGPVTYLGRLADDGFGRMLRACLDRDGAAVGVAEAAAAPTTLSVADVDENGAARYRFYLAGTSAPLLDGPTLVAALPADVTMLHAGTLGLVVEPFATAIEEVITAGLDPAVLIMIDPNFRPNAITDRSAYLNRLWRVIRRADIVKVSTEDLAALVPDEPDPLRFLLDLGARLILVTDGAGPARAITASWQVRVPVPAVEVADTIGAGDAFGGAFLAWWARGGFDRAALGDPDRVRTGLRFAVEVAALTCTHIGAEPPWASELPATASHYDLIKAPIKISHKSGIERKISP